MRIVPSSLPHRLRKDPKLSAERKVFDALKRIDFERGAVAFHSLRLSEHRYKRESELDFVVLAPSGLFVLEVKGGGVSRDGNGRWHFTDRYGRKHSNAEGPFRQAQSGMYSLLDALCDRFEDNLRNRLTYGFGVVTPDARLSAPTPEWGPHEILDRDAFTSDADLERFLKKLRDHHRSKKRNPKRFTPKQLGRAVQFLRPRFDRVPPLQRRIDEAQEKTESLTEEQYRCLDYNALNDRLLCRGGAGTGKTFLALEVARRESGSGRSVLLVCRSPTLASFLRGKVAGADVHTVAAARLNALDEKYDTLVVDEGQDLLTPTYLAALDDRLRSGMDGGRWRFFYDPNRQSGFYEEPSREAINLLEQMQPSTAVLDRNCRNPLPIVQKTRLYTGGDLGKPAAGAGAEVGFEYAKDDTDSAGRLQIRLRKLFSEGVSPQSISILSPRPYAESSAALLSEGLRRRIKPLDDATAADFPFDAVSFSSVRDFKGFENDVVLVVDLDPRSMRPSMENVLYVAMSRARVQLIMILRNSLKDDMEKLAEKHIPLILESESRQPKA